MVGGEEVGGEEVGGRGGTCKPANHICGSHTVSSTQCAKLEEQVNSAVKLKPI